MTTEATKLITAEELFKMGDIGRCELIYGELIMMSPAGPLHGVVAACICSVLHQFVRANDLGAIFAAETGFKIEDPDLVRAPDVSFVRKSRLASGLPAHGYFDGVPDLAVEVVSPTDRKRDVADKVNMWLAHGTASVWVADPVSRSVAIHRAGKRALRFSGNDEIRDDLILPGFAAAVSDFFKLPGRTT